jgi:hypothetical protein
MVMFQTVHFPLRHGCLLLVAHVHMQHGRGNVACPTSAECVILKILDFMLVFKFLSGNLPCLVLTGMFCGYCIICVCWMERVKSDFFAFESTCLASIQIVYCLKSAFISVKSTRMRLQSTFFMGKTVNPLFHG